MTRNIITRRKDTTPRHPLVKYSGHGKECEPAAGSRVKNKPADVQQRVSLTYTKIVLKTSLAITFVFRLLIFLGRNLLASSLNS
jgi:hypothetical protein